MSQTETLEGALLIIASGNTSVMTKGINNQTSNI